MNGALKNELAKIVTVAVAASAIATSALAADTPSRSPTATTQGTATLTTQGTATAATQGTATPNADNTSMNSRDKSGATLTPQDQNNRVPDRELLAAVRRAVTADKSLSSMAHNVKIVATDGVITLRGPVKSQDEKSRVEKAAKQVAGVSSVQNQLDVKVN